MILTTSITTIISIRLNPFFIFSSLLLSPFFLFTNTFPEVFKSLISLNCISSIPLFLTFDYSLPSFIKFLPPSPRLYLSLLLLLSLFLYLSLFYYLDCKPLGHLLFLIYSVIFRLLLLYALYN